MLGQYPIPGAPSYTDPQTGKVVVCPAGQGVIDVGDLLPSWTCGPTVVAQQPGTISYAACDAARSPWSPCAGGAVIGPNGARGVCGPCDSGPIHTAAGVLFGGSGPFPQVTPVLLIGAGLLLVLLLAR